MRVFNFQWLSLLLALFGTSNLLAEHFNPRFYVFQNGVKFGSYENEAKVLKELGYDGISQVYKGGKPLAERIIEYEKQGLNVLSIYLNVKDKPIAKETVLPLANKNGIIELTIREMNPQTVEAVRATSKMAEELKIKVALYPHHGFAVETTSEAIAFRNKVNHPNLGIMFNLCHFLKNEHPDDLEKVIQQLAPHLFAVSISGAEQGGSNWEQLIQTLNQGSFPQKRLLLALKKANFQGPVSLQCFRIPGDKKENLTASMLAWRALIEDLK